ncbi:E3 ubiquitin-protein ligase rnf213-alpha-like [Megalops cyprinoides]|uniref:E3 ubiquitin-protein ligase rnf213-alpha-like n=1 Tax=Megalops cyprinoides TaxID=118141 RepID=UPI00186457A8|nr:E3 ubiquitin-protein ligase rnf213-alpha-like [Megalops cyprinoides]
MGKEKKSKRREKASRPSQDSTAAVTSEPSVSADRKLKKLQEATEAAGSGSSASSAEEESHSLQDTKADTPPAPPSAPEPPSPSAPPTLQGEISHDPREWHQYDDIICAKPDKGLVTYVKNMFSSESKDIAKGRHLAAGVMLKAIFDLLRCWSPVNVHNFFCQLGQFVVTYSTPLVFEEKPKVWESLGFGEVQPEVLEEVVALCNTAVKQKVVKWILVLPLLHLLRGDCRPFESLPSTADPGFESWAGLQGISLAQFNPSSQDTRALLKLMAANSHLLSVDRLVGRSWMSLLGMEALAEYCSSAPVDLLDALRILCFSPRRETFYSKHECAEGPEEQLSSKSGEVLRGTLQTIRAWLRKTFRNKLLNSSVLYTSFTSMYELQAWNNLLSLTFAGGDFTNYWRTTLLNDFEGKLKQERSENRIEIYCGQTEEVSRKFPALTASLEKCALDAVTAICQEKSENSLFDRLKGQDFRKFGKLVSAIILKAWPRDHHRCYLQGEELVVQHLLTWSAAKNVFQLQGAGDVSVLANTDGTLMERLTDSARERMAVATSAFTAVAKQVLSGKIRIKTLNQILKRRDAFIELLKIDCLSESERCSRPGAIRRLLQSREEEVRAVHQERALLQNLLTACRKLQGHVTVDVEDLESKLSINMEEKRLDELMEVHLLDEIASEKVGVVTYFSLPQATREMAEALHVFKESFIFKICWERQAETLSRPDDITDKLHPDGSTSASLSVVQDRIFQPCYRRYREIYENLKSGRLMLEEVDNIFEAFKGKYEELGEDLQIMCRVDPPADRRWVERRVQQIEQYHELHLALESARVIMEVKQTLCPQGDFQVLETLLSATHVDFKRESLDRIDNDLMKAKKVLVDITEARRQCLQELDLRRSLVLWVKEALEDINELKVFVDLASISAGENDLDVDRVACFHDAVLGYSSMLYDLKPDADFPAFRNALMKLWKALETDNNLPKKLRDTARHLEWLKTVKDSHGSVELSSLSLASAINKKGIYIIGAQNQKKLSLETALRLELPESQEEGPELRCYWLEDLRELQNKLMLMSGKGEQGQGEVDHFAEAFSSVQRLATAFIDLHAAGNPLFRRWEAKISCSTPRDAGIIMDFNLTGRVGQMLVEGSVMEQLPELCRKMERCLTFWSSFMDKQRSQHYYLNYYTAEQILYLCDRLAPQNLKKELDDQVLMLLSFIRPTCRASGLKELCAALQSKVLSRTPEQKGELEFQTFVEASGNVGEDQSFEREGGPPTEALQNLVDQAHGSGKLDLVWNAFMRDVSGFLPHSLDVCSLGRLLEALASEGAEEKYEEEDEEEFDFPEREGKVVRRTLPSGFSSGVPNLIICPHVEVLTSCICVYMSCESQPLPTYDEVLLCTTATPYQQVELFLRRCLTAGYRGEKIYTLLCADQLTYEVSCRVEQAFQRLRLQAMQDYRLVIICSSEREHAYLPSAFSQYRLHMVPQEPLERIRSYLSKHYTIPLGQPSAAAVFKGRQYVGVVSSKRAGVGKSLYIQRLYEKLEESAEESSLLKCIRLIEPRVDESIILKSLLNTPEKKLTIFHFDVTSSVQRGLYEFLFKLLILGYLMDDEGCMWRCHPTHLYAVEILRPSRGSHRNVPRVGAHPRFDFLDIFPEVICRPPKEVLELEMRMQDGTAPDAEDPLMDDQEFRSEAFQRPYQYLTRFYNHVNLDRFMYGGVEGTHVECLQMLFVYCGIMDPSWAELKNFTLFLNLQLRDCETSVFCNVDFVGDTLQGFKNFVVDFMILMAKDFATPSLSISDQSLGRQQVDLTRVREEDLAPFLIRKRWESEPHPYIFFNEDHASMTFIGFHLRANNQKGFDAIDPASGAVIRRNIMTKRLYNGLRLQRVPFNVDFEQLPRGEKIERLCNVLGIQWPLDPDETYELTTDNILKMLAIHMRFRCGIPVIIMGETGCGKTRLVRFLCELRRGGAEVENMRLVKVHGGTTSEMIYRKIREAEAKAISSKQEHGLDSVLFFDEANTTEAISSIKEVLCDGAVEGEKLNSGTGLQIIAACNPYRKHTDEMIRRLEGAGLGYRVRAEATEDKLGSIPLRQLVYRVQALPPSMIPLVWDFGQLNDHTEKMYIQQIVQRVVQTSSIANGYIGVITDILSSSQKYMRTRRDECSFVSLRDVERCVQVFVWFYDNSIMLLTQLEEFLERSRNLEKISAATGERDPVIWALVMAAGVCYHASLENKDRYRREICRHLPEGFTSQRVMQEISLMQDLLLSGVPLGETIARNSALKENVFMMVICIELRIPLFLVGKPGSSKSLSKTLVADAMQGQAAHSELYKRLKQIHLVSFQCSPHSTPEGIINTFKQCARFQEGKNLKEYISVVVLDEIGLAEDSPKMPLKTLHPLLEEGCIDDEPLPHKKVGFIGISNWALDPAKMNRGIFVSRGDPDEKELMESAKGICSSDLMILEKVQDLFQPFAQAYLTISKGTGFFGLRDYYSLIKMVFAFTKASKQRPSAEQIVEAVLRNFSGKDDVDVVKNFTASLRIGPNPESISAIELVRQNISDVGQDDECRYLLVLTKNYAALQILQETFFDQHQPEIIFGSSFPKDQEYTQICRNINRVKICMETGQTVVLLNLQNLYESLYDALNQYYVFLGGQKYVDLGLGTHRVKCRVHADFRLIVIEEKEVVYKQFPVPLINRLEKHYLDINAVLDTHQKEIARELERWVEQFMTLNSADSQSHKYKPPDVFVGYHADTCSSVVLQVSERLKREAEASDTWRSVLLEEAKLVLLNCATPDSVVRLDFSALPNVEAEQLAQVYFQKQKHSSLVDFVLFQTQQKDRGHSSFTEVTTFSRLLTAWDMRTLQDAVEPCSTELLSLQQFDTEHSFLKKIRHFLDSTCDDKILIIQTEFGEDRQSANILASAKYSAINEINKSGDEHMAGKVLLYFITKLPRVEGGASYVGFHGGTWSSVHIDDLRRSKDIVSEIKALRSLTISQLFEEKTDQHEVLRLQEWSGLLDTTSLLRSCVQAALSMLRDQAEGGARSTRRVEILLLLLGDSEDLNAAFLKTVKLRLHSLLKTRDSHMLSPRSWVFREASNVTALQEGGTFKHALWKRIQAVVTPFLAQLVTVVDRDHNLDLLLDRNCSTSVRKLWLDIFADETLLNIPYSAVDHNSEAKTLLVQHSMASEGRAGCSMPFSCMIRDYLEELWQNAQQREDFTRQKFEEIFHKTPLGRYVGDTDPETQRELFHRYLQDVVSMTLKMSSEDDLQLLCRALSSCVAELRTRHHAGDKVPSLAWVHIAHHDFHSRLHNLGRMLSLQPRLARSLLGNVHASGGTEMVLDVFAAVACVELLEPEALDSDRRCQAWLGQVKRLQVPIELVCSEQGVSAWGERSREMIRYIRSSWKRVFVLSLFVEQLLLEIESVEPKLKAPVLDHVRGLGKVLERCSDVKLEEGFVAVIEVLKSCRAAASSCIFRFGLQPCPVCRGDHQEPLDLPCKHIYCLACIKEWLIPGQMYCPLCKEPVPDDFTLRASEDIRRLVSLDGQFRKRCNAFFIDLVSGVCFEENHPPSQQVVLHLLSFLMMEADPVPLIRAHRQIFTKALSPFQESVDKTPVVRSVVLKLLLKYSFDEVKDYLQQHLTSVEQSIILDEEDKANLYALYINCLEDSMFERLQGHTVAERRVCLQGEADFLHYLLTSDLASAQTVTVNHLHQIARVRLCLDLAAHLLMDRLAGKHTCGLTGTAAGVPVEAQTEAPPFLRSVMDLCERSGCDWYRVYLIRRLCGLQGLEFVQNLLQGPDLSWLCPKEIRQQSEDGGHMDQYLVCGEDYRTIRDAVARATVECRTDGVDAVCEKCDGPPEKHTVFLLLALFREVTTLCRASNPALHPTPELREVLEGFVQSSRILVGPEVRAFATGLVRNEPGPLCVRAGRPSAEHALIELTVHLTAVLLCGKERVLAPLRQLALSPANMQASYIPTMPEDMLAAAQRIMGPHERLQWYTCQNGHPCAIGECGRPVQTRRCLDCNAEVGGRGYVAVSGFTATGIQGDRTQRGHILGDPQRRDSPVALDTRSMAPVPFTLIRLLTHLAMLQGASGDPQSVGGIVRPPVPDPGVFLMGHLQRDVQQLGGALGKATDDTVSVAHLVVRSLLEPRPPGPAPRDDLLSTKESRSSWEMAIATNILSPQLKHLEQQLAQVNASIRSDSRVSSDPVVRMVFGDPQLLLASLRGNNLIHWGAVWSCRERVTLARLAHIVEQNNGRDAFPLLWGFLQKEAELRLVKFLPDILALQRDLVKRFQNRLDFTCCTLEQFIQNQAEASRRSWQKRVRTFLNTWNQLRVSLATNGEIKIPAQFCQDDLDLSSDLQVLLPRRQGLGLCSTALVSYLIALHNQMVRVAERHTGEETSYTVSPADLTPLHVIRYEVDRDLLSLILSNCQYSLERGQETVSEYDLPKIQQLVLTRFLQGKPLISLTGIPTLVSRQDRNYEAIFRDVKGKIGQEPLPALTVMGLMGELQSHSDLCEALGVVDVTLAFLASTGGRDMELSLYLEEVLQMADQLAPHILTALSRCRLKHCVALWQLLASLKSESMLRLKRDPFVGVSEQYRRPLGEQECRLLMGFFSRASVDTCLLEMHQFLLLHLKSGHAPDTYRPDWGLKETLVSYMEREGQEIPLDMEEFFPEEIGLSQLLETWKFTVSFKQEQRQQR